MRRVQGRPAHLGRPFLSEIIHPETGELLPDGEPGELVLTSLTKEANPIIRYRTRDLTRLLPGTARSMRRMEKIAGRSDDMLIILRGVNVFPSQIEELVLKQPQLAPNYLLEVTRPHTLDELSLSVELRPRLRRHRRTAGSRRSPRNCATISSPISASRWAVRIVECGQLERSIGKAKRGNRQAIGGRRSSSADFFHFAPTSRAGSRPGRRGTFLLHDTKVPKEACPASPV
jgi:phenylacetate-CoA ligase